MKREFAKTTSQVARGVPRLAGVHRDRARRAPLGVMERHEIVEHRRPHAAPLCRVHPLAEHERVEAAREPLDGRAAGAAPAGAERVRGGEREEPRSARDTVQRGRGSPRGRAGSSVRTRRARAVPPRPRTCPRASRGCSSRSRCAGGRAARRRRRSSRGLLVDERVEVRAQPRSSVLPGITSAGTSVGVTVKRTTQRPLAGSSGTRSVADPSGGTAIVATGCAADERGDPRQPPREQRRVRVEADAQPAARAAERASRSPRGPTTCRSGRGRSRCVSDASGPRRRQSVVPRSSRATTCPSGVTDPSRSAYGRVHRSRPSGVAARSRRRRRGQASPRGRPASARTCSRRCRRSG